MIHNKEIMNFGVDIAKQCSEANLNLCEKKRTFPLKKKRFGELAVDEIFLYHEKKLKKIDNFNAISISKFSKSNYLFNRGDLVDIEDLDHLLIDPQVKKSSESLMERLAKQPILNEHEYNKILKNETKVHDENFTYPIESTNLNSAINNWLDIDKTSIDKAINNTITEDVLKSIHIRYEGKENTPSWENFFFISTNLDPEEKIFTKTPENCWDIDLGQQKVKMNIDTFQSHNEFTFLTNVSLKSTIEGTMNIYFDSKCVSTIKKEKLSTMYNNGDRINIILN